MSKFVNVKFDTNSYSSVYTYKIPDWVDPVDLGKDVLVIVPAAGANGLGFAIAKVTSLQKNSNKATKYIVDILDTKKYKAEIVRQAKLEEMERNLKERYNKLKQDGWLDELLLRDPESANLIRQFKELK